MTPIRNECAVPIQIDTLLQNGLPSVASITCLPSRMWSSLQPSIARGQTVVFVRIRNAQRGCRSGKFRSDDMAQRLTAMNHSIQLGYDASNLTRACSRRVGTPAMVAPPDTALEDRSADDTSFRL